MSSEEVTLRQIAITVWHRWSPEAYVAKEATEAELKGQIERFRAELHSIVGERPDIKIRINGGCIEAEVEDLRFISYELTMPETEEICTLVSLIGRCPACGTETASKPFNHLATLGMLLERFEPGFQHCCPTLRRRKSDRKE